MTSLAAIHAAERPPRRFVEPNKAPPRDDMGWIMLVMLLSLLPTDRPAFRRHLCSPRYDVADRIIDTVAELHDITVAQLKSDSRNFFISHPRQIAMHLMHRHAGLSTTEIGRKLGNRDHSTISHGCQAVKKRVDKCWKTREAMAQVVDRLGL